MAINAIDESKLITLKGLNAFLQYFIDHLVNGGIFSNSHFTRKKDNQYNPGTDGVIDVKLGKMVDDSILHNEATNTTSSNYNIHVSTNQSHLLTNGQTIVSIKNGDIDGENLDNNNSQNLTGLGQTIPNTFGLTVSNSVFKARGAEIDWTNGRSWDTLNYMISPGVYTINYKIPTTIPDKQKNKYSNLNDFLINHEFAGGGLSGLDIPKNPGEIVQIRLTVTSIYIGEDKKRLRVYQQAQILTSEYDRTIGGDLQCKNNEDVYSGKYGFHNSGNIYVRVGEGPSGLRGCEFADSNNKKYTFTDWKNISDPCCTKIYKPVAAPDNILNDTSDIKFQDNGVFTLTPNEIYVDYGSLLNSKVIMGTTTVYNHKSINVQLPDFSTLTTKKPQKCTLYVYNYSDVTNQYLRLYIEKPQSLYVKGKDATFNYLSHDVMCSVQLDRYVNHIPERDRPEHTRRWFTAMQWGQLPKNDSGKKYQKLRLSPHWDRDYFFDTNSGGTAWGAANGVYKYDITILYVDNTVPLRQADGAYSVNAASENRAYRTAKKYYHILVSVEYLGPLDPTYDNGHFVGMVGTPAGINCSNSNREIEYYYYYNKNNIDNSTNMAGSITHARAMDPNPNTSIYGFAMLDGDSDKLEERGLIDYKNLHNDPSIIYNCKN